MPEQLIRLRKASGGSTLEYEGQTYSWPEYDPVAEVPHSLAVELLAIQDSDYRVEGDPEPPAPVLVAPGLAQTATEAGLGGSEEDAADEAGGDSEDAPAQEGEGGEPPVPPDQPSPVASKPRAGTARRTTSRGTSARRTGSRASAGRGTAKK